MELGLTGTGGAAVLMSFAGVRRNAELRPISGLDATARVGLRPVEPSREGLLSRVSRQQSRYCVRETSRSLTLALPLFPPNGRTVLG